MGERGPQPTPTEVKRRAGNPGKRPLNENEPKPQLGAPNRPEFRDEVAEAAWEVLCHDMAKMSTLAQSDGLIIELCADAVSRHREARLAMDGQELMLDGPKGGKYMNPLVCIERTYAKAVEGYVKALGLTPTARSNVQKIATQHAAGKSRHFSPNLKVVG